jgi:hypothetical protein
MSFDTGCERLADAFLVDEGDLCHTPANVTRLAQAIQDAIEGELEAIRESRKRHDAADGPKEQP